MTVTYVLRVYDATGSSFTELPLSDGSALGYPAFPVYDENGTLLFELVSSPEEEPPTGELPYHDDAGLLLGTLDFNTSAVGSGYERVAALLQSVVALTLSGPSSTVDDVTLLWDMSDSAQTSTLTLRTSFVPTGNTLLERSSSSLKVRINGDVVLTVESKLEQGEGEALAICDVLSNAFGGVAELRVQSPRLRYSGRRTSVVNAGERGYKWVHEFVLSFSFDYLVPRRSPVGDATRNTFTQVTIDVQTYLQDEVFTPLGVVAHFGNAVSVDPDITELAALVRINQVNDSSGGPVQVGSQQLRRRSGTVSVELSGLSTAGASSLWRTVDELVEKFSRCSRGAAVFQSPLVTGLGVGGAQASLTVQLPFYVDERLPVPTVS